MKGFGQRGGFVLGLVVGLLVGLSLALGVALYITKAPIPFINKVPPRTAEQDRAEAERNRHWDPNAPLAGRPPVQAPPVADPAAGPAASAPPGAAPAAPAPTAAGARDPAAILAGGSLSTGGPVDPFVYFVQVGAFQNADDAEQQRARLAMTGWAARVTEREQSGRTVYRVRVGPFERRDEAEASQGKLTEGGFEARLVRVERTP